MRPYLTACCLLISVVSYGLSTDDDSGTVRNYIDSITELTDSVKLLSFPTDRPLQSQALELRASLPKAEAAAPLLSYSIIWDYDAADGSFYRATFRPVSHHPEDTFASDNYLLFQLDHHTPVADSLLVEERLREGFGQMREENTLGVELDFQNGTATVYGGEKQLRKLITAPISGTAGAAMGIQTQGRALIHDLISEYITDRRRELLTQWTEEELSASMHGAKAPQGFYRYLDRQNASEYLRPGGKYTMAIIEAPDGGYDIIYLNGAERNASAWTSGMKKGHLEPTVFENHFDLRWFDASLNCLSDECNADYDPLTKIMTFNFPLLKSSFRFSCVPIQ